MVCHIASQQPFPCFFLLLAFEDGPSSLYGLDKLVHELGEYRADRLVGDEGSIVHIVVSFSCEFFLVEGEYITTQYNEIMDIADVRMQQRTLSSSAR